MQYVGREELHKQHLSGKDLMISVGGDGTCLSASHYIDDHVPLLAINSDPTRVEEKGQAMRRSVGALCACSTSDMEEYVGREEERIKPALCVCLYVVCCMLYAVCCMLYVVRWSVVCNVCSVVHGRTAMCTVHVADTSCYFFPSPPSSPSSTGT